MKIMTDTPSMKNNKNQVSKVKVSPIYNQQKTMTVEYFVPFYKNINESAILLIW